jgi:prepilin-type N-terminal cleavage/methylation domain-containing protein
VRIQHEGSTQAGFSLLEVLISLGVLLTGLLAYGGLTLSVNRGVNLSSERATALEAARAQLERLRSVPFDECFAAFDGAKENDSAFAPGPDFHVKGLTPVGGGKNAPCGRVIFPTVADGTVGSVPELREDVVSPDLGMPRDLDGDGAIDAEPKNSSYVQLPVIVEVRWTGVLGEQRVRLWTVLSPWKAGP